jgi:hypothetical protein
VQIVLACSNLFENAELPEEFLFFQLSIPGPKRFASKGHPGIFPSLNWELAHWSCLISLGFILEISSSHPLS